MNKLRTYRASAISAGVAAGLFALVGVVSSASAQNAQPYWLGDPSAPGPAGSYANGPMAPAPYWDPNYQQPASGPTQPYWLGAPNSPGPA